MPPSMVELTGQRSLKNSFSSEGVSNRQSVFIVVAYNTLREGKVTGQKACGCMSMSNLLYMTNSSIAVVWCKEIKACGEQG